MTGYPTGGTGSARAAALLDDHGGPVGSFRLEVVRGADHGLRLSATGGAERGPRIPDLMEMLVSWLRRALRPGRE